VGTEVDDVRIGAFRPIRQRRAADEVIAVVADAIRSGLYRPGDFLPRQADLAERLQVSRSVVREALEILRRAGVVDVRRGNGGGNIVAHPEALATVLSTLSGPTHTSLLVALQYRRPLEMAAAPLAAQHATVADLARLEHLVATLESLVDEPDELRRTDIQFHVTVARLTGNNFFHQGVVAVNEQLLATLAHFPGGGLDSAFAVAIQRETLEALASRDRDRILEVMDRHLAGLEESFLGGKLPWP
jgi:GntR family transcriptional repressor for pyruvate dehydrogenase complex